MIFFFFISCYLRFFLEGVLLCIFLHEKLYRRFCNLWHKWLILPFANAHVYKYIYIYKQIYPGCSWIETQVESRNRRQQISGVPKFTPLYTIYGVLRCENLNETNFRISINALVKKWKWFFFLRTKTINHNVGNNLLTFYSDMFSLVDRLLNIRWLRCANFKKID